MTTNAEILRAMSDAANAIVDSAGLDTEDRVYQYMDESIFGISLYRGRKQYAQWSIEAIPPIIRPKDQSISPARLTHSGMSITPLSLSVIAALDALMWEERER